MDPAHEALAGQQAGGSGVVPGRAASASSGSLSQMHNLRPQPRPVGLESAFLEVIQMM